MSTQLCEQLAARFGEAAVQVAQPRGEVTLELAAADWLAACTTLRDEFGFDTFIDLCGVDYLGYGSDEWDTVGVSSEGFSRGVEGQGPGRFAWGEQPSHEVTATSSTAPDTCGTRRFAVVIAEDDFRRGVAGRPEALAAEGHAFQPAKFGEAEINDARLVVMLRDEDILRL